MLASTDGAHPLFFTFGSLGWLLVNFLSLAADDAIAAARHQHNRQCLLDCLPARLLRKHTS
jgi:hypothetical protein